MPGRKTHQLIDVGRDASFDALCVVDAANPGRNSIYGDGIVSAMNAIKGGHHEHDD